MAITKLISTRNWKAAIGEVILIVVGISIALAFDSWRSQTEDREDEQFLLRETKQALELALEEINRQSEDMRFAQEEIDKVLSHLATEEPFDDAVSTAVGRLWRFRAPRLRAAPFESIKLQGLDLISNAPLRLDMIALYEDIFPSLQWATDIRQKFALEQAQPFLTENFRRIPDGWTPHDLENLRDTGYLESICQMSQYTTSIVLSYYDETIAAIEELLLGIDAELDL